MIHTLLTVGYGRWKETKQRMPRLLDALNAARVTTLVDIRHSPCAADPGTVGNYVAKPWNLQVTGGIVPALKEIGIEYRWIVELGNPQKRDPGMAVLRTHIDANSEHWPVNRGLRMLANLVCDPGQQCCLLCACEEFARCHRSVSAEALSERYFSSTLEIIELGHSRPKSQFNG